VFLFLSLSLLQRVVAIRHYLFLSLVCWLWLIVLFYITLGSAHNERIRLLHIFELAKAMLLCFVEIGVA
jgi:hypothetical protein